MSTLLLISAHTVVLNVIDPSHRWIVTFDDQVFEALYIETCTTSTSRCTFRKFGCYNYKLLQLDKLFIYSPHQNRINTNNHIHLGWPNLLWIHPFKTITIVDVSQTSIISAGLAAHLRRSDRQYWDDNDLIGRKGQAFGEKIIAVIEPSCDLSFCSVV